MKRTPLPDQQTLQALLSYNPETGELRWKPRACKVFNGVYAGKKALAMKDSRGYPGGGLLGLRVRAHRVIWKLVHGVEADVIDHIDRNCSNNRLANLRSVTQRENIANRGPYKTYAGKPLKRAAA